MTEANQVRINELARELEVKAKAIIDLLPGYGVSEKKTHSSSIPEDVSKFGARSADFFILAARVVSCQRVFGLVINSISTTYEGLSAL